MTKEQKDRIAKLYFCKQFRHIERQDEVCAKIALKMGLKANTVYNYINSVSLAIPNIYDIVRGEYKRQRYAS